MNPYDDGAFAAALLAMTGVMILLVVVTYVLSSFFLMKIFQKAGVQGAWRAWVPVYNMMVFTKLGDLSPWLVLYGLGASIVLNIVALGFIGSIALAVVLAMAAYRVGLKLQKEPVWVVLWVLLSIVWLGILAFDRSRWNPAVAPAPWAGNAFLADNTVWDGVPTQTAAAAPGYGHAAYGQPAYGEPQPGPARPGYPAEPGQTPIPPVQGGAIPPVPPPAPGTPPRADEPPAGPTPPVPPQP